MRITSGAPALALPATAARRLRWHVAPGGVVRLSQTPLAALRHVHAVRRARCRLHTGVRGTCDAGWASRRRE